jgi:diacylglycerol kinase family enzyme
VPVGYIPSGTANDVAYTLSLASEPTAAAQKIVDGKPRFLDVGKFRGDGVSPRFGRVGRIVRVVKERRSGFRYFTYIAAFGAFTGVSYMTPQSAKRSLGHFAYILGGLADMTAIKPYRTVVEYDGKTIEGDYIFGSVMNSASVAGFVRIDRELVDLADGLHEVVLIKQPVSVADFFDILATITAQEYSGDNVQMIRASKVRFLFDEPVSWTVDGEDGGSHKSVEIDNCHEAVRIIV